MRRQESRRDWRISIAYLVFKNRIGVEKGEEEAEKDHNPCEVNRGTVAKKRADEKDMTLVL